MDYKEKYEQALSRARQFSEKPYLEDSAGIVEYIFPELKESELAESEDEKIRKEIRDFICWATDRGCITKEQVEKSNSWLAWLEKQGEQKVSVDDFKAKDWYVSKVDGKIHNIYYSVDKVEPKFKVGDYCINAAWSEEDEETLKLIKFAVLNLPSQREDTRQKCLTWLESLKDRVQPIIAWNENDEVALESAATNYAQDKYLPVQTSQAFIEGAKWILTKLNKEYYDSKK